MIATCLVRQKTSKKYKFDYLIPESFSNLKTLDLVEVPFLRKKVQAVVLEIKQSSKYATKEIVRVLSSGPIFTHEQLALADAIAYEFLSDLPQTLFSFLPILNKGDLKKISSPGKASFQRSQETYFIEGPKTDRLQYFIQTIDPRKQNLLLFPEVEAINEAKSKIKKLNPSIDVFIWHSSLSSKDKMIVWNKVSSGSNCLIISSRHGLFLPFRNLANIFIDRPSAFGYFEDQDPRYNAYKATRISSKIYKSNLLIGDSSPSSEVFVFIKQNKIKRIKLNSKIEIHRVPALKNIFSSNLFIQEFKKAHKILVAGYFKHASTITCQDCFIELKCAKCENVYFKYQDQECLKCGHKAPELCDNCKSIKLKESFFSFSNITKEVEDQLQTKSSLDEISKAKLIIKSLSEAESLSPIFDMALLPHFDLTSNIPFLNSRINILRSIRELVSLGITKIFISSTTSTDLEYMLENNQFDKILTEDLRNRRLEMMPPFTRYLELTDSDLPEELQNKIKAKIIENKDKKFAFLTHSQVKILQEYVSIKHPDLKARLDSPDFC